MEDDAYLKNCSAKATLHQLKEIDQNTSWSGTSSLSIAGKVLRKNRSHRMPDRLKIVFTNGILDDSHDFSYLHECSKMEENIFEDDTFKMEMGSVPKEMDNVVTKRVVPRPGTNLKDNFLLEGTVFGVYDSTLNCQDLESKTGRNVTSFARRMTDNIPYGPMNEFAIADRYRVFYRKGSLDNIMYKDKSGNLVPTIEFLHQFANKKKYYNKYNCLADWLSKVPEGFSCAKPVPSVREYCHEIYEPVDCSKMIVKVAPKEICSAKYGKQACPETLMENETLKSEYCNEYYAAGTWKIKRNSMENMNCCCNKNDCCNDCFSWPYLGL